MPGSTAAGKHEPGTARVDGVQEPDSDRTQFFIRQGDDVQGPFGRARIRALVRRGRLRPEMELSRDRVSWTAASEVPGLFDGPRTRRSPKRGRARTAGYAFRRTMQEHTPDTYATFAIIGLNALVYLLMVLRGVDPFDPSIEDLLAWGADYGPLTTHGEWWRLLTSTFVHAGIVHLLANMVILFYIGRFMERLLGRGGFVVLYVFAGLIGSLASLAWNDAVVSAGASGAVFGLFGGVLGFLSRRDRDRVAREIVGVVGRTAAIYVVIQTVLGLMSPRTDVAAHVGGFVGGFAMGYWLGHPLTEAGVAGRRRRWIVGAGAGLLVVAALCALFVPVDDARAPIERFAELERRMLSEHPWAFGREVAIPPPDEARRALSEDVLPTWREAVTLMDGIRNPPDRHAHRVALLRQYAHLRLDALEARLEHLEQGDESALQRSEAKEREISRVALEIMRLR